MQLVTRRMAKRQHPSRWARGSGSVEDDEPGISREQSR
jgi:hypothetical protein